MVICPIARAVHCTGCMFFKLCPAKTILGDYDKNADKALDEAADKEKQKPQEKPDPSNTSSD